MYCTKCGAELRDDDRYCSRCGNLTGTGVVTEMPVRTLMLDKRNKKISGVCAGFARYFGVDIVLMRVIWLAAALGTGIGFLVYFAAWIAIPSDRGLEPRGEMMRVPQRS